MNRLDEERIFERDGWRCVECGSTEKLTVDHIIPRVRGGKSAPDNLQTMCRWCNHAKGATVPEGVVADPNALPYVYRTGNKRRMRGARRRARAISRHAESERASAPLVR
jgi:HNH endonuclease